MILQRTVVKLVINNDQIIFLRYSIKVMRNNIYHSFYLNKMDIFDELE